MSTSYRDAPWWWGAFDPDQRTTAKVKFDDPKRLKIDRQSVALTPARVDRGSPTRSEQQTVRLTP